MCTNFMPSIFKHIQVQVYVPGYICGLYGYCPPWIWKDIDLASGYHPIRLLHLQYRVFFLFLSAYVTAPSAPWDSSQIKPEITCPGTTLTMSNILPCPASPFSWELVELVKINWLSCFCWLCNALLQTFWGDSVHFLQLSGEFYQWRS